jgi:Mor family transcriptional regulator
MDIAAKLGTLATKRLGVPEQVAKSFGVTAAWMIADDWGGQNVYIPRDVSGILAGRNEQIYREFTGDNVSDLAKRYCTSVQHIYRIIRAERAKRAPRQGSLFD